jgi:hypothetical protein
MKLSNLKLQNQYLELWRTVAQEVDRVGPNYQYTFLFDRISQMTIS